MTAYCVLSDVRDFGVSTDDASDARVTRAIARATTAINNFTGQVFGVLKIGETITLDSIVYGTIPLPQPFANITAVTINGVALNTSQWEVRDYGIKLFSFQFFDADGFRLHGSGYPLTWAGMRRYPNIPSTVKVTADFGSTTVDPVITEAAIMLAAQFSRMTADDMLPSANIKQLSSGTYTVAQGAVGGLTTGNLDVDDMLSGSGFVPGYTMVD